MTKRDDQGLVSLSDIAELANVSRAAVSNWRKRRPDFPAPAVGGATSKPLFNLTEVKAWLEVHASRTNNEDLVSSAERDPAMMIWTAMNALRGSLNMPQMVDALVRLALARKRGVRPDLEGLDVPDAILANLDAVWEGIPTSQLGPVVDFALQRLVRSEGKRSSAHGFVGSRTSDLLANLVSPMISGTIYDPACGSGAFLIAAIEKGARPTRLVGHERDLWAFEIAQARAELYDAQIDFGLADALYHDLEPQLRAEVVVVDPPLGQRLDQVQLIADSRFEFGPPPRSSADLAWLQHAIAHLSDSGRAYAISTPGTLFRGGEEGRIRRELVRRGCVVAVVGLPAKFIPQTAIPLVLWVLRKPDIEVNPVLIIDAADVETPEALVSDWLRDPASLGEVPNAMVSVADVLAADALLTPRRWVDRPDVHPDEVAAAYAASWSALESDMTKLLNVKAAFNHFRRFSKSRVLTVGELIDQGVLEMKAGRPKDYYEDAPQRVRDRIATAGDVTAGTLREVGFDDPDGDYPELTEEGDVLVTTWNTIHARVDDAGGHLPSTGVFRLRVTNNEVLSRFYLAMALRGGWNERFIGGATIRRAAIKELEVPLLPKEEQRDLQLAAVAVQLMNEHASAIAAQAATMMNALLDAVRFNAPLADDPDSVGASTDDDADRGKGEQ